MDRSKGRCTSSVHQSMVRLVSSNPYKQLQVDRQSHLVILKFADV